MAQAPYAGWRRQVLTGDHVHTVTLEGTQDGMTRVGVDDMLFTLDVQPDSVLCQGRSYQTHYETDGRGSLCAVWLNGIRVEVAVRRGSAAVGTGQEQSGGVVRSPMNGQVLKILAPPGTQVAAGDCVLVLEAMKMENEVRSPVDGRVTRMDVQVGQTVAPRAALFVVTAQ